MADEEIGGGIAEKFELILEYQQVIRALTEVTRAYNKTLGDVTKVGVGISQSFSNMSNMTNAAMGNMSSAFAQAYRSQFAQLRTDARDVGNDIRNIMVTAQRDLTNMAKNNVANIKQAIVANKVNKAEIVRKFREEREFEVAEAKKSFEDREREIIRARNATELNIRQNAQKAIRPYKPETAEKLSSQAVNKMNAELKALQEEYGKSQKDIAQKYDPEVLRARIGEENRILAQKAKTEKEVLKGIQNDFLMGVSDVSVKASRHITQSVEGSSSVIAKTVNDINGSLSKVTKTAGSLEEQVAQAVSGQKVIDNARKGAKTVNKSLSDMQKDQLNHQKVLDQAAIAQDKIKILELDNNAKAHSVFQKELANVQYTEAQANQEKIHKLTQETQGRALSLNKQIEKAQGDLPSKITAAGDAVKQGFGDALDATKNRMGHLNQNFDQMLNNFSNLGKAPVNYIATLNRGFADVDTTINQDVSKLQTFENMMNQLGKVGYEDAQNIGKGFKSSIEQVQVFKKEMSAAVKELNNLTFKSPLTTMEPKFKENAKTLRGHLQEYEGAFSGFQNQKLDSVYSVEVGNRYWQQMVKSAKEAGTDINRITKQINQLETEYARASSIAVNDQNQYKRRLYQQYADSVREQIKKMYGEINAAEAKMGREGQVKAKLQASAKTIENSIQGQIPAWNNLDYLMKVMQENYKKMEVYATRHGKANYAAAQKSKEAIFGAERIYQNYRKQIQSAINDLSKIKDMGLVDTQPSIDKLNHLLTQYKGMQGQVRSEMAGTSKMFGAIGRDMEKSFFRRLWEGFRQIRWQTAALVYMGGMVGRSLETHFIGMINEIDEFRKSVFALTGTVGFVFGEHFKNNFDLVYNYSRDLMDKLQAEAAGTYASLEDMQMVTRTLAQHGIFAHTDEDVERIGTLATSIKVLTEGMANEGVQMRQELMALVEGRTRVTDSVARMLKNQGIDIVKEMKRWEREGTPILEGMAKLLEPFAEVNKRIGGEWSVAVNYLKIVWQWIKRIAGENLVLKYAQDIKELAQSLGKPGEMLTERGKALAELVQNAMEAVWSIGKGFLYLLEGIGNLFGNIFGGFAGFRDQFGQATSSADKLVNTLRVISKSIYIIGKLVEFVGLQFREWVSSDKETYSKIGEQISQQMMWGFLDFMDKALDEFAKRTMAQIPIIGDIVNKTFDYFSNNKKDSNKYRDEYAAGKTKLPYLEWLKEKEQKDKEAADKQKQAAADGAQGSVEAMTPMDKFIQDMYKHLQNANAEFENMGNQSKSAFKEFSINMFGAEMTQPIANFNKQQDELLQKYDEQVEKLSDVKTKNTEYYTSKKEAMDKELQWYKEYIKGMWDARQGLMEKYGEREGSRIAEGMGLGARQFSEAQDNIQKVENQLDEAKKKVGQVDWALELRIDSKTAASLDQFYTLMDKFGKLSPFEKIENDFKKSQADIYKWSIDAAKNLSDYGMSWAELSNKQQELYDASALKRMRDIEVARAEMIDKNADFARKALGVELTEVEKIEQTYRNMRREIEKAAASKQLGDTQEQNEALRQQLLSYTQIGEEIAKAKKLEEERTNILKKQADVAAQAGDLLQKGYNSSTVAMGKEISLRANYAKSLIDDTEAVRKYGEQWGNNTELMNAFTQATQEGAKLRQIAMEYELERVQRPFWAELEQMSKSWADTISDNFADVLMGTKKWTDAFKEIFTSITKQFLTLSIKKGFVEPMMEKFSSNFGFKQNDKTLKDAAAGYLPKMMEMQNQSQKNFENMLNGGWMARGTELNPMIVKIQDMSALMNPVGAGPVPGLAGGTITSPIAMANGYSPQTNALADAIKQIESGGSKSPYTVVSKDKGYGAYQYSLPTWNMASSQYSGYGPMEMTPENQEMVSRWRIEKMLNEGIDVANPYRKSIEGGYSPQQVMATWNSGSPFNWENKVGVNKYGVSYSVPNYVNKVSPVYEANMRDMDKMDIYKTSGGQPNILDTQQDNLFKTSTGESNFLDMGLKNWDQSQSQASPDLYKMYMSQSNGGYASNAAFLNTNPASSMGNLGAGMGTGGATPVYVVNMPVGGLGGSTSGIPGVGGTSGTAEAQGQGFFSKITSGIGNAFSSLFSSIKSMFSGLGNMLSGLFKGIGGIFSGGGSGGGMFGGLGGNGLFGLFGGGDNIAFAEGGKITEPIVGRGLKSGKNYSFGEKGDEYVFPEGTEPTLARGKYREVSSAHISIQLNAIDTQTGTDFLMKNMPLIEARFNKAIRNNKSTRDTLRGRR